VQVGDNEKKDPLLRACVEAATRAPMDSTLFSPGGTVTNRALQTILDGLVDNGLIRRSPQPPGPGAPTSSVALPTGEAALETPLEELEELLDPDEVVGPFDRRLLARAYRESQDEFRAAVLAAYSYNDAERCCITGYGPSQALQAAHIVPWVEGGPSIVSNGLCLRADLHLLFDSRLIAVHETELTVLVHPVLVPTPYGELAGEKIHVPRDAALRPAPAALRKRREDAGL